MDIYEKGYGQKDYDRFFDALKKDLVPFVKQILEQPQPQFDIDQKKYAVDKQEQFTYYLQGVLGYDLTRGVIKQSAHPFTSHFNSFDVRITTKYHEDNLMSATYSTIHEIGHALYEQNVNPELAHTNLGSGASLGLHESQSRFYENVIGRSKEFWTAHYTKLQKLFPEQLQSVSLDDVYSYVNIVKASYVRIEADELTYPLHIMLRYDIEREIFSGQLTVEQLPQRWNELVEQYLGLAAPDYKNGVMQDVHWAGGAFGYFPTYALGSAISAQILNAMQKDFDVFEAIQSNKISKINKWLTQKLHQYGSTKDPKELIRIMTGEDFNPKYYINYLKTKYKKIYKV